MVYGLILAAGNGKRMNLKTKKQFIHIKDKPLFVYSIENFLKIKEINKIYIIFNKNDKNNKEITKFIKDYKKYINNEKIIIIYNGGKERYNSVNNALNYIYDNNKITNKDSILIHDSARIKINIKDVKTLIKNLNKYKAVTLATKSIDTIKTVYDSKNKLKKIKETIDRNIVYSIKTPQGFNFNLLYNAYKSFIKSKNYNKITDDIMIIEKYTKLTPYILETDNYNIKITTKEDLTLINNTL